MLSVWYQHQDTFLITISKSTCSRSSFLSLHNYKMLFYIHDLFRRLKQYIYYVWNALLYMRMKDKLDRYSINTTTSFAYIYTWSGQLFKRVKYRYVTIGNLVNFDFSQRAFHWLGCPQMCRTVTILCVYVIRLYLYSKESGRSSIA